MEFVFLDYFKSANFDASHFWDADHLNIAGAKLVTKMIDEYIHSCIEKA